MCLIAKTNKRHINKKIYLDKKKLSSYIFRFNYNNTKKKSLIHFFTFKIILAPTV